MHEAIPSVNSTQKSIITDPNFKERHRMKASIRICAIFSSQWRPSQKMPTIFNSYVARGTRRATPSSMLANLDICLEIWTILLKFAVICSPIVCNPTHPENFRIIHSSVLFCYVANRHVLRLKEEIFYPGVLSITATNIPDCILRDQSYEKPLIRFPGVLSADKKQTNKQRWLHNLIRSVVLISIK